MSLLSIDQYCKMKDISERTFYRWKEENKVQVIPGTDFVYSSEELFRLSETDKEILAELKMKKWNEQLKNAHNIYKLNSKPTAQTTQIISLIEAEASFLKDIGFKIKGFDKRSLQIKVKTGKIERQKRQESKPIRNDFVRYAFPKAMELIGNLHLQRAMISVNEAVDRAIYYAKSDENYYEVAACEKYIYTLRRHIRQAFKASRLNTLHEFINHFNKHNKKRAYVKGAFTDDIEFMDIISLDDHKFDVAGAYDWDELDQKWRPKKIYSWFVVEMKTLFPMGYEIKSTPFTEEDIVKLLMKVFRQYGKPNKKVIMDNGLAASERVLEFIQKLGIVHEVQPPYTPTAKANNERIFKLIKEEQDVYMNDFVGSNHPEEGRHSSKVLSPDETLRTIETAKKQYDIYVNGYYLERPRTRDIKALPPHLLDNTKRVSIKTLYDHYYRTFEKRPVTDIQLRYAYMKHDTVKSFKNFYITFKKEVYLPVTDVSLVLNDPSFRYLIAYDPSDLNRIDMYAAQDILDSMTGEFIAKGDYVCTLESLAMLDSNEKKARVNVYNKKINKAYRELANNYRAKFATQKDMVNTVVSDNGLIDIAKEQTKQVEKIIKSSVPVQKIEVALERAQKTSLQVESEELTDSSINELNEIHIEE